MLEWNVDVDLISNECDSFRDFHIGRQGVEGRILFQWISALEIALHWEFLFKLLYKFWFLFDFQRVWFISGFSHWEARVGREDDTVPMKNTVLEMLLHLKFFSVAPLKVLHYEDKIPWTIYIWDGNSSGSIIELFIRSSGAGQWLSQCCQWQQYQLRN